jgi:hypothetical protein
MPSGHLRHYLEHYFAPHPSSQVRELFISTAILDFATAAVMLFEPLYLFSLGLSLRGILLFYLALYVLYFFLLPIGGRICRKHGYEHSILYSSPFLILYYISLFAASYDRSMLVVAVIALAIQKILYWPGYHANFATWGGRNEQGREISNRAVIAALASTFAPAFGGAVIAGIGYPALFFGVCALILLSNIPLFRTPHRFEPQEFPYSGALKMLGDKRHRRKFAALLGFGEELIALVLLPIFISLALPGIASFGALMSAAMLMTVLTTLYTGRLTDEERDRSAILRIGAVYSASSWLLRPFVGGSLGIGLTDSFYRVSKNVVSVPLLAILYGEGRRGSVMDTVIFFEMALGMGKILAAAFCIVLLTISPDNWMPIFLAAAGFTLMYAFWNDNADDRDNVAVHDTD